MRKFGYKTNGHHQAKEGCKTCFGKTIRPVGYEREVKGYIIVKTALYSTKPSSKDNWKLKHQWIWEQTHNTKLPKGWVVRFKDGNTRNFEPSNLDALPRGLNQMINDNTVKLGVEIKTAEDYDAIKAYCELKKKIHDREISKPRRCIKCGALFVADTFENHCTKKVANEKICRNCLNERKTAPHNRTQAIKTP